MSENNRKSTLLQASIPIVFLMVMLFINVSIFGDAALDGSNQIVLMLSTIVASVVAFRLGFRWDELRNGIVKSITAAMSSILILLLIGSLAGSWMLSGIVPAMIYYGLQIINPTIFLFAACLVCAIVSVASGSSWTTAATVGIALVGMGKAIGVHEGMVAGAVISGSYFGDKMSPLSDTTNLAPAMAGTDLFTHIKYMTLTTVPSIGITLLIFLGIGFIGDYGQNEVGITNLLGAISSKFYISPVLFLVPIATAILIAKKIAPLPALSCSALLGILFALIFQQEVIAEVSEFTGAKWKVLFSGSMKALYGSISIHTENEIANELLSSGGMAGMLKTVWLILSAMAFGGVMECTGMLKKLASSVLTWAQSSGSLIASTAGSCMFFNITTSDQYMSIVVPGRMYADYYKEKNLAPENLSRTLEDSGTVTSVLVPWNTCGAFHSSIFAISPLAFIPYCFFNILSPLMTILYGYLNIKIKKLKAESE